jgi:hypothetical protein
LVSGFALALIKIPRYEFSGGTAAVADGFKPKAAGNAGRGCWGQRRSCAQISNSSTQQDVASMAQG